MNTEINTEVAAIVLAGIRSGRGVTLVEMSTHINSSPSYVSNLENYYHHKIDSSIIGKYSRVCDVSIDEIFNLINQTSISFNSSGIKYFMYRDHIENQIKSLYRRDRAVPRTRRSYNR